MRILLTGNKGFIGSHLEPALKNLGHEVIGIDLKEGLNILDTPLPEVDTIVHLAAISSVLDSVKDPETTSLTNIQGTIRLLNRYKDKRFIFASTGGAIQETIESPYALSKFCAEEFIKMFCKDFVILRFANIYGERSHSVVEKFMKEPIHIYGDGSSVRNYVHVDDLVRGIIQALKWPSGLYKMGGGTSASVKEIAEMIGKEITYESFKEGELKVSKVENTTPDWKPEINLFEYICETCQS